MASEAGKSVNILYLLLLGGYFLAIITSFLVSFTFRWYLRYAKPKIIEIEDKYTAVRRCLQTTGKTFFHLRTADLNTWLQQILGKIQLTVTTKFVFFFLLVVSAAVGVGFLPLVPFSFGLAGIVAFSAIASVLIIGVWSFLMRALYRDKVRIKPALDSMLVVPLATIPAVLLTESALLTILIIFTISLFVLGFTFTRIKELSRSRPELLGETYYEWHLQMATAEDAESFMKKHWKS